MGYLLSQCAPRVGRQAHELVQRARSARSSGTLGSRAEEILYLGNIEDLRTDRDAHAKRLACMRAPKHSIGKVLDRKVTLRLIRTDHEASATRIQRFIPVFHGASQTRNRPPSTISFEPVLARRFTMHAMIALATSSGSTTRRSGVDCAIFSSAARSRPATKPVDTAPGDTHIARTFGPNARANDI